MEINHTVVVLKQKGNLHPDDVRQIREQWDADMEKGYLIIPQCLDFVTTVNATGKKDNVEIVIVRADGSRL